MGGHEIVREWKRWKETEEGRKALNPYTLETNKPRSHEYLENRLEAAFQAGIKAAEQTKARCTKLEAAVKLALDNSEWTSTDEGDDSHALVERADYEKLSALIEQGE